MADIRQAAKWLNEGKKVCRREHLKEGSYFFGMDGDVDPIQYQIGERAGSGDPSEAPLWPEDLLATDWIIFDPKKRRRAA